MNKNYLIALNLIRIELVKKIKKLEAKRKDPEKFEIIINGDKYNSEIEILEAYGCNIISSAQRDTAMKKFREWEKGTFDEVLDYQIRYYKKYLYDINQGFVEEKVLNLIEELVHKEKEKR